MGAGDEIRKRVSPRFRNRIETPCQVRKMRLAYYNVQCPLSALTECTPDEAYRASVPPPGNSLFQPQTCFRSDSASFTDNRCKTALIPGFVRRNTGCDIAYCKRQPDPVAVIISTAYNFFCLMGDDVPKGRLSSTRDTPCARGKYGLIRSIWRSGSKGTSLRDSPSIDKPMNHNVTLSSIS